MKLYSFIAFAGIATLSSCENMHEPIYYSTGNSPVKKSTQATAAAPITSTAAPVKTTPRVTTQSTPTTKPQRLPTNNSNSPFMQPDVLGMPSNDDLKETSSSTRKNNSAPGLTVPN